MLSENSIGNLSFELQYKGGMDGIALKKKTESVVTNSFVPALQQLLDRYSPGQAVISIDEIICEINTDDGEVNEALTGKIMQQLEKQLIEKVNQSGQNAKPPTIEMHFAETLFFYLENGYMPWWAAVSSRAQLNELILRLTESRMPAATFDALLTLLKQNAVVNRICNDFEDTAFWSFFKLLPGYNVHIEIINDWQSDYLTFIHDKKLAADKYQVSFLYKKSLLKSLSFYNAAQLRYNLVEANEQFALLFTATALQALSALSRNFAADATKLSGKLKNDTLKSGLKQMGGTAAETSAGKETPGQEQETGRLEKPGTADTEPVYINNSGLVIIAPYLGRFFKDTGAARGDEIIDATKAVTLLNYIATGRDTFAEFEIVLPKLLCGLEPQDAVAARYAITGTDKESVNELLSSVIVNWPILKNTWVEGLRETFLMREGKLTLKENGFHLKVQQNAVDVLLDHLPWNISMVKLPWMKNILFVDWM
jgi:hypothetical protein